MKDIQNLQVIEQDSITVDVLLQSPLNLQSLTGNIGYKNLIKDKNVSRPQLALTGYFSIFTYERVQIFGNTEIHYLSSLPLEEKIMRFSKLADFPIPCVIITNNNTIDADLIDIAKKQNIAILTTNYETTKTTSLLSEFLDDQFAPQVVVHGSFVDVYGVGILFIGKSGIGKSEIALDLVERGHRIVADDIVMLTKKGETILMGTGTSMVQHFMEIRGLGIIDIRQMFGIRSIRFQKRLEIVVELEDWNSEIEYTRTGLDEEPINMMGVEVQYVKLPIFPGKNVTVIAEVIALNYLLRTYGYNAAKVLTDKLTEAIQKKSSSETAFYDQRLISYFQSDKE